MFGSVIQYNVLGVIHCPIRLREVHGGDNGIVSEVITSVLEEGGG